MKLSIVLSIQPASFSALAYKGHWEENIAKIRSFGYDGVELAVRDPKLLDMPLLNSRLAEHCLLVPAIGTGQVYGEEGLSFTYPEENVRKKAIERVGAHVDLASGLGAAVIIGLVRGKRGPGVNTDLAELWLVEALRVCAAKNRAVKLALEPINRYETDLINTTMSGLKLVEKIRMENVGLLLDTFHMNIEEPSLPESILSARDRLFHFHIADSNRWHPGAGHTDFRSIVDALDRISYKGFLSAEILPLPDPDTAARNTVKHMRALAA
jgi:sugar phosphate isomerase/epimerase